MNAENLTPENVAEAEELFKALRKDNNELSWNFHKQTEKPIYEADKLDRIEKKIDALTAKIELIFGNSVLINGNFQDTLIQDILSKKK